MVYDGIELGGMGVFFNRNGSKELSKPCQENHACPVSSFSFLNFNQLADKDVFAERKENDFHLIGRICPERGLWSLGYCNHRGIIEQSDT